MKKILLILLVVVYGSSSLVGQSLRPFETKELLLNKAIELDNQQYQLLADTSGNLSVVDIIARFEHKFVQNSTKLVGIDRNVKSWWLKTVIKNSSPSQRSLLYILSGGEVWADVTFYYQHTITRQWVAQRGGWLNPEPLRATNDITDALLVELEAGESRTIYICRKMSYLLPSPNESIKLVVADKEYHETLRNDELLMLMIEAMFLGIVLMMTIYNFSLFVAIREKAYFWYVWVILAFGLSFSEDTLYTLVANSSNILYYYKFIDLLNALAVIFNTFFVFNFARQTPRSKWFWVIAATNIIPFIKIILLLSNGFTPESRHDYLNLLFIPNAILHLLLIMLYGIKGILDNNKDTKILTYSGLALLFSLLIWNLHLLVVGEILTSSWTGLLIYLSPKLSFMMMAAAFSRHLTSRIRELEQHLVLQQLNSEREKKNLFARQNELLEAQVRFRTAEIEQQKEEIETQRDALEFQNIRIMQQNEEIWASINAAKRIQNAMLPLEKDIAEVLPSYFILFRPRDIVSGDFYWFSHFPPNTLSQYPEAVSIIAAVDCTGHGVPGAFMSMIGNELLNEIVNTKKIIMADLILEQLHNGVNRVLQQEETANRDGMDLALCVVHQYPPALAHKNYITYAGANNPLYYVNTTPNNGNQFVEIKATKKPIGGTQHLQDVSFQAHTILLEVCPPPTTFYLFSDGYQDQFGGTLGKKFMVKKLKELFTQIADQPMEQQKVILEETLAQWQRHYEQVDDILVLGFRVTTPTNE